MANIIGPNCIIQSDFTTDGTHGNLEAFLLVNGSIQHWTGVPPNNGGLIWSLHDTLPAAATGPASVVQSRYGIVTHGNFEVVLLAADGLWHWRLDNSNPASSWTRFGLVSAYATGPGSIIQSSLGPVGNLEVVVPEGNQLWHYTLDGSNPAATWQREDLVTGDATGPGCIIQSSLGSPGNFEVVLLESGQLWHHWRDNSNPSTGWRRAGLVSANASSSGSIIQSNLGTPGHFEVVVLEGNNLVHHWHDNSDVTSPWQNGKVVSVAATGPGSIAQSTYGPGGQGNFEVLAQELIRTVVHYWFHNVDPGLPWWRGPRIQTEVEVASNDQSVKISQVTGDYDRQLNRPTLSLTATRYGVVGTDLGSSFQHAGRICFLFGDTQTDGKIRSDPDQDLDTVAFTTTATPDDGILIVCNPSYPKVDNIDQSTFCVPCDGVSVPPPPPGPAWLIQTNMGDKDHGTFEVVVLEGSNLVHWTHDNAHVTNPWRRNQIITTNATGGGCIIQSHPSGNFEVVVPEGNQLWHYTLAPATPGATWQKVDLVTSDATGPACIIQSSMGSPGNFEVVVLEGNQLWHHWLDNSNPSIGWRRAGLITSDATGAGCIIQSNMGSPGNFEVVVPENNQLRHYWHDNSNVTSWWQKAGLITSDATGPACIIQSNFGSPGNFEVVVLQGGSVWHHWHDNSNVTSPWQPGGRVAMSVTGPACLIQSNFGSTDHGNFEVVVPVGPVLQHFYHDNSDPTLPWTPAEIVTATSMYVFFTTDRINDPGTESVSMGRCVLARSDDDGVSFGSSLFDLSTDKFINLSLQVVDNYTIYGLPQRFGQGLLIWATGRYRASNVYLGYVPLASIEDRSAYLFYAGISNENLPIWVADEARAQSLFLSGNMGELCVRWNPFLREFVMAYNSDNGGLILARQAATPWGPWTGPESIFDYCAAIGAKGFLNDPVNSNGQGDPNDADGGVPYAPYFIQPYTRANPDQSTTMFYLVSVHNPYQVELMSVRIRFRALIPQSPKPPHPESGPFRRGGIHDPAGLRG
jgi:hypothetical protein